MKQATFRDEAGYEYRPVCDETAYKCDETAYSMPFQPYSPNAYSGPPIAFL